jgi:hypothetical protein
MGYASLVAFPMIYDGQIVNVYSCTPRGSADRKACGSSALTKPTLPQAPQSNGLA